MRPLSIKATVSWENKFWVAIFERVDGRRLSVARKIFPSEPSDPEIYDYVRNCFAKLNFSEPREFFLVIKRKNPKRLQREIGQEMKRLAQTTKKESYAQEMIRLEREKNKLVKKRQANEDKERVEELKFRQKQAKKKQKKRGR
jgi:hypothetical protein